MNILVIFSNRLGDTILSLPFIRGIKESFPDSKIYSIASKELLGLLKLVPEIEDSYPKIRSSYPSFITNIQTAKALKKERKHDICFCLSDSFSTALIAFFAGIKIRVGHKTDGRSFLLTHGYDYSVKRGHLVDYSFNILNSYLKKKIVPKPYTIKIQQRAEKILPKGKNLVFNINSLGKSKIIPIWKAVEMINAIQQKYDYNIILIGAKYEAEAMDHLRNQLAKKDTVFNYAGKTDLVELAALLTEADLMISTDTGTAHLANAVETKLIVFFGSGDYKKSRPYNLNGLEMINKHLDCSPCLLKDCKFGEPICLTQIENKEIAVAIDKLIAK